MKKQAIRPNQKVRLTDQVSDRTLKILLIGAVVIYCFSLVFLANMALANETNHQSALIKVNPKLDGAAFADVNANVKSVNGNVLAIDVAKNKYAQLNSVQGVCAAQLDHFNSQKPSSYNNNECISKYAGANVVVGVLDNSGTLNLNGVEALKKVEAGSNVGFISYLNNDPNSTIIIRNLKGGESNLVQALSYMQEYAKTVEKPLVIEMVLDGKEMKNSLFVQVCQKMADAGIQFIGSGVDLGTVARNSATQLAFTMYNKETGQITDQTSYWSAEEIMGQELMLMGSDRSTCGVMFNSESGFGKLFISNESEDVVMVTAISEDGMVHYYNVENKETALIPRLLFNGLPVLEDGLAGIYPHLSKTTLFNGENNQNQMVTLSSDEQEVQLASSEMNLNVSSKEAGILGIQLDDVEKGLRIQIKDKSGKVVYMNHPDHDIESLMAKVDLSDSPEGLYFLDLTSPQFHQTFALLMD